MMADENRPFADLRDSGLLWLINTSVFHPRGLALAIRLNEAGVATGWELIFAGDGTPFTYEDSPEIDALFRAAEQTMNQAKGQKEANSGG